MAVGGLAAPKILFNINFRSYQNEDTPFHRTPPNRSTAHYNHSNPTQQKGAQNHFRLTISPTLTN
jgi:hypothetical protein